MISIMCLDISTLFDGQAAKEHGQRAVLFRAGDAVQRVFLVRSGRIGLLRFLPSGGQVVLHRAGPGEMLAEASLYTPHYHCDGVALEDSSIASISVADFRKALQIDQELANAWAARLAHQVQQARMRAELRSLRTVSDRLSAWFDLGGVLPPKGQWQEVADELSVSREAFYRELAKRKPTP